MLIDQNRSPYDVNFSVFGTPVRVSPWFWFFTAILGWDFIKLGIGYVLLWVACAFVSILLHEFGHVWAGRLFGTRGDILLYSFGGLAFGASDLDARWQRVIVYLAGPGIQFALYGIVRAIMRWTNPDWLLDNEWLSMAFIMLLMINWWWPIFNLLPVWPLDGGKVTKELCETVAGRDGFRIALGISIATAAFLAVNTLLRHNGQPHIPYLHGSGMYTVILFALLAYESFQLLQIENSGPRFDDRLPWER